MSLISSADRLGLTEEERQKLLPSGRQRVLHNRIHWAKFYLTKAGIPQLTGTRTVFRY